MPYQLFSATGCSRCSLVKSFMERNQIAFNELDIKADHKKVFQKFYRDNRSDIFRGEYGIEFPILYTGEKIFQGAGVIISFLRAGDRLKKFITRSDLAEGWINGFNIHDHSFNNYSEDEKAFLDIIEFLHRKGLMIQLETDGRNAGLLETLLEKKIISRLIFTLRGPADLYESITGMPLEEAELIKSLSQLNDSFEYQIVLPVSAFIRKNGQAGYLTPEEAGKAAQLIETATHSKKHKFFIQPVLPEKSLKLEPPATSIFFKYRTQCRRHMVLCEVKTT